jgi:hypothetical protein
MLTKEELIERTKNWGEVRNPDGTKTIHLKLSFEGSVDNLCRDIEEVCEAGIPEPIDTWGVREASRLYKEGREAWLRGDFETVADLFGVLV